MTAGRPVLAPGELGSPRVEKLPGGKYTGRANTRDAGGVRRRLRATGTSEADVLEQLGRQAAALVFTDDRLTLATPLLVALHKWLEDREGEVKPQSLRIYRDTVRWFGPMAGAVPLGELDTVAIKKLFAEIKKERRGGIHAARAALNGAFGLAVEEGVMRTNPLRSLRRRKAAQQFATSLDAAQVGVLRERARQREEKVRSGAGPSAPLLRWVIELRLGSGLRISEVLALRNMDIDWDRGRIAVTGTLVDDENWGVVRQEELKSREQARLIELPRFSLAALREARSNLVNDAALHPLAPAIQGRSTGNWVAPRNIRRSLRSLRDMPDMVEALQQTGLMPSDLVPHTLRRTAATLVAEATGDLRRSKELIAHADERTTRAHYAGVAYRVVGSATLLDDLIGVEPPPAG